MEHEHVARDVARRSALIYIPVTLIAALLFLLAATVFGSYPVVARIGGTIWVGLLTLIITMPLVTARVKQQAHEAGTG
jgi:uncharacterized membrane protein YuzA (DUF378 family)